LGGGRITALKSGNRGRRGEVTSLKLGVMNIRVTRGQTSYNEATKRKTDDAGRGLGSVARVTPKGWFVITLKGEER